MGQKALKDSEIRFIRISSSAGAFLWVRLLFSIALQLLDSTDSSVYESRDHDLIPRDVLVDGLGLLESVCLALGEVVR